MTERLSNINNSSVTRLLYRAPYCNVIMMARFSGVVSSNALEKALEKARGKYPLLNSRILQDSDGNIEFLIDYTQDYPVFIHAKKTESDWIELGWNEQKIPFDMENGPLIKFLLLNDADTCDLVIICHHCICDGLSLAYLAKDIAFFLDNPDTDIQPFPVPPTLSLDNLSVNVPRGITGRLTGILALFLNRSWSRDKVVFIEQDYHNLYKEYWREKDIGLIAFNLSKDITAKLIEKCHTEQVTVNSALTTAFSLAQNDLQGNSQSYLKKALLAISIRRLYKNPPGENFGLLAVGNEIRLPSEKDGFWSVAKNFDTAMRKMLSEPKKFLSMITPLDAVDPTLLDAIYFSETCGLQTKAAVRLKNIVLSKTGKPKRSLDITNLGVVKANSDNLRTIYFLPILSTNYEKTFGIVTINGEINMVMMHDRALIDSGIAEAYKSRILKYIDESYS